MRPLLDVGALLSAAAVAWHVLPMRLLPIAACLAVVGSMRGYDACRFFL
jgi:hypothetical protein